MRVGNGYLGSPKIETSTENQEIIPALPNNENERYKLYKLSFFNHNDCTVVINNQHTIFLRAETGFQTTERDALIYSFVIKEAGVKYEWRGCY